MTIPDEIQERLRTAQEPSEEGVQVVVELIEGLDPMPEKIAGLYIMPPHRKEGLVRDLLERTGIRPQVSSR